MAKRQQGASLKHNVVPKRLEGHRLLPAVLVVTVVIYGAVDSVFDPESLPVNSMRIETPLEHVQPEQLREVVGEDASTGFLHVDVDQIRTDLETLPWVKRASVRRSWPDQLVLRIEEQQPMARWAGGGLVNAQGELFQAKGDDAWLELPLLRGPQNTEQVMAKSLREMQEMLTPVGLKISHLTMNERRSWDLRLRNGLRLGLGKSDVNLRLLRFVRVYVEALKPQLHAIDSVDLRYTNGFAVRWHDGQSPAAA